MASSLRLSIPGCLMNILVWILQALLAVAFLAHGWMLLTPPAAIADQLNASLPRWFQLFLGVAEVLAAVGLTLPAVTRILPRPVVWASVGIVLVVVFARVCHLPTRWV